MPVSQPVNLGIDQHGGINCYISQSVLSSKVFPGVNVSLYIFFKSQISVTFKKWYENLWVPYSSSFFSSCSKKNNTAPIFFFYLKCFSAMERTWTFWSKRLSFDPCLWFFLYVRLKTLLNFYNPQFFCSLSENSKIQFIHLLVGFKRTGKCPVSGA